MSPPKNKGKNISCPQGFTLRQGYARGFCSEKGLLQRTSNAAVFLSLTAPGLLCGSSLFAAQAHKSTYFRN